MNLGSSPAVHSSTAVLRSPLRIACALALAAVVVALTIALRRAPFASPAAAIVPALAVVPTLSAHEPIQPIPKPAIQDPGRLALGARLFGDVRLSSDGKVSCASCHDIARGGVDQRTTSVGAGGVLGAFNTPTIFNAALNPKQFWDGHADTLEDQIDGPVQSPREMGSRWPDLIAKLTSDVSYMANFRRVYSGPPTPERVKDAIATYERTLVMRNSRFDRHLAGDPTALSAVELEGLALFKSYGCASCHQGRNVGGNVFEVLGILGDYFAERGTPITPEDLGRYNVTKRPEDRFRFRVPSLRLVALTPPYLHDGSVKTLEDAIRIMGRFQLGEDIPPPHVTAIAAFLQTLSGSYDPQGAAP